MTTKAHTITNVKDSLFYVDIAVSLSLLLYGLYDLIQTSDYLWLVVGVVSTVIALLRPAKWVEKIIAKKMAPS